MNKILEFYNNDRSHDFDEGKLRTQLKYFSANLPKKETLILDDMIDYFQELEPSCKNLLSEVRKIIELIPMLSALAKEFVLRYSVLLNKRAARLFFYKNLVHLHALIRYLHVY